MAAHSFIGTWEVNKPVERRFFKPIRLLNNCVIRKEMTEVCMGIVLTSRIMVQNCYTLYNVVFDNRMGVAILSSSVRIARSALIIVNLIRVSVINLLFQVVGCISQSGNTEKTGIEG
jgi:hypothetical protein